MKNIKELRIVVAALGLIAAIVYLFYLVGWVAWPNAPIVSGVVLVASYLLGLYLQRRDTD